MPAALLMSLDMLYEVSAALQFVRPGFNPAGLMLHRQAQIQKATVRSNAILNVTTVVLPQRMQDHFW